MTVKELSEKLKEYPEDASVMVGLYSRDNYDTVLYDDDTLENITMSQPYHYADGSHCYLNVVFLTNDEYPEY